MVKSPERKPHDAQDVLLAEKILRRRKVLEDLKEKKGAGSEAARMR